ncbi:lipopolysaccharide 1,2-glucosyltransferase [Citrobacter freundii]|uniref:glycosyltransferase n=1 Tax=Citrobacter freundii TaxID=546 RepID=UPI0015E96373|nr:glycosyltransferase [Citrobacter freundii]QLR71107.1 lipopolysaccharide 1,2-glucosyltransferase [Citrobacter freundii]QLY50316.1 lipopolysaccharide 1,2-glucosyltransferase [Citrobacter freundii]
MKTNIIEYIKHAHTENTDKQSTCVNITYGADKPFLYGTGVSITSILLNNPDLSFHFHIFTNYLDEHQFTLFSMLANKYNTQVTFYVLKDEALRNLPTASKAWNYSIYFRLIAIDYFADKLNSIIYLDSDIICKGSIKSLLLEEFNNNVLMAVHDRFVDTSSITGIYPELYFNSGFMYFNLPALKNIDLTLQVISKVNENNFTHPDQDALNVLFNDRVKIISHIFNSFFNIDTLAKKGSDAFSITAKTVFIHYVGVTKPWHDWAKYYAETDYFKIARVNSPWKDIPLLAPTTYKQLSRKSTHLKHNGHLLGALIYYIKYLVKKIQVQKKN